MKFNGLKRKKTQVGFGILEIAIILSLLSALAFVLMIMPDDNDQLNREQERKKLRIADEQIINFIGLNGRLPCPDSNGNGSEDCNVSKGTLPYVTLGLKEAGYSSGDIALKYGVYRNSQTGMATNQATADAEDADLAVRKNRYEPLDANGNIQAVNNINTLDFCAGLTNGASATFSTDNTYIEENNATRYAVAYAISSPGANGIFDGLNGQAGQGFNAASNQINPAIYDDHVLSRGFIELYRIMQCDVSINSLNIMANAVLVQDEVKSQAEGLAEDTEMGAILAAVGVALNATSAILAGVDLANAGATLATASGLLAGAVASCVVLVGCALIPVYTAAVTAATTGVVLSGVAVGASVAAVVAQAVATGLYADAAIRANSEAASVGTQDWSSAIADRQLDLVTAQSTLSQAQTNEDNLKNQRDTALATYNTNRNNIINYAATNDDPDFSGTPDVTTQTESLYAAIQNTFDLRNTYFAAEEIYTDLQQQCDACPDPNVDTIIPICIDCTLPAPDDDDFTPVTGTIPEYTIYACEESDSGTVKICDEAAAQKLISDAAETAALTSRVALNGLRNTAMTAALNYQIYTGTDGDGNKTFSACKNIFSCQLPRWLDNTWDDATFPISLINPYVNIDTFDMDEHYYALYLLKEQEYEVARQDTAAKQSVVDALTMSISAMQCSQDGKTYRETVPDSGVFECVDSSPIDESSPVNFAQGAKEILDSADQRGISE